MQLTSHRRGSRYRSASVWIWKNLPSLSCGVIEYHSADVWSFDRASSFSRHVCRRELFWRSFCLRPRSRKRSFGKCPEHFPTFKHPCHRLSRDGTQDKQDRLSLRSQLVRRAQVVHYFIRGQRAQVPPLGCSFLCLRRDFAQPLLHNRRYITELLNQQCWHTNFAQASKDYCFRLDELSISHETM